MTSGCGRWLGIAFVLYAAFWLLKWTLVVWVSLALLALVVAALAIQNACSLFTSAPRMRWRETFIDIYEEARRARS